jgi:putative endonuclease
VTRTAKQGVGALGEAIAARFLEGKGFTMVGKNYLRPWGEIDLIAKHNEVLVFVEVKTVSRETTINSVHQIRPEENMHREKIRRLSRAIETYLLDRKIGKEVPWRLDLVTVEIDILAKTGKCRHFESVF